MTNRIKAILTALMILSAMCATAAAELPATWDWRNVNGTNYVTPIKQQGACGSCAPHAALAAVESKIMIEHGIETNLSEQYFVSECFSLGDCQGMSLENVLQHGIHVGFMSEECFPKNISAIVDFTCPCEHCDCWKADRWLITGYRYVSCATDDGLKTNLMEHGPLAAKIQVDHGVLVVGWNETVWICKNSGGLGAGTDEGYTYEAFGNLSRAMYVLETYQRVTARYDTNNNCHIEMGELAVAIEDWQAGTLEMSDLAILIGYWQSGESYCE